MISQAIRYICEYICEHSIFPELARKISGCSREYTRSHMRSLITQHTHRDDLETLRHVVPQEMLLYILGMKREISGEMIQPLPFPTLTATSACIIASYLEMIGVLPPWCTLYSSTRSLRPIPGELLSSTAVNTIPRGSISTRLHLLLL